MRPAEPPAFPVPAGLLGNLNLANVKRPRFSSHLHIRRSFGGGQSDVQPKSPSVKAPMRRAAAEDRDIGDFLYA